MQIHLILENKLWRPSIACCYSTGGDTTKEKQVLKEDASSKLEAKTILQKTGKQAASLKLAKDPTDYYRYIYQLYLNGKYSIS